MVAIQRDMQLDIQFDIQLDINLEIDLEINLDVDFDIRVLLAGRLKKVNFLTLSQNILFVFFQRKIFWRRWGSSLPICARLTFSAFLLIKL